MGYVGEMGYLGGMIYLIAQVDANRLTPGQTFQENQLPTNQLQPDAGI
jgi:hypothetical protein